MPMIHHSACLCVTPCRTYRQHIPVSIVFPNCFAQGRACATVSADCRAGSVGIMEVDHRTRTQWHTMRRCVPRVFAIGDRIPGVAVACLNYWLMLRVAKDLLGEEHILRAHLKLLVCQEVNCSPLTRCQNRIDLRLSVSGCGTSFQFSCSIVL